MARYKRAMLRVSSKSERTMWKCTRCETLNSNQEYCKICHQEKEEKNIEIVKNPSPRSRPTLVALIIALIVVNIIFTLFFVMFWEWFTIFSVLFLCGAYAVTFFLAMKVTSMFRKERQVRSNEGDEKSHTSQEPNATSEENKKTFLAVGAIATICVTFAILVIIGLFLIFRTSYVEIPDLTDLTEEAAIERIEELRFTVGEITKEYNRRIEAGLVISQSPRAGGEIERGSAIDLVISLGIEYVEIPDVTDSELDKTTEPEPDPEPELEPEPIGYITIGGERFHITNHSVDLENMNLTDADIEPLQYMENLRWLNLGNNRISDLTPLSNLTYLRGLSLDDNQISDLTPLSNAIALERLFLNRNQISDLTPLSGLANLRWLFLESNQVSDLTPLSGLSNLTRLRLVHNPISDVTPLSEMTSIMELCLHDEQIDEALFPLNLNNDLYSAIFAYREFLSQEHSMTISLGDDEYVINWDIGDVMHVELVDFNNNNVPELVVVIRPLSWDEPVAQGEPPHWTGIWAGGMIYVFGYTGEVELLYEGLQHGEGGGLGAHELAFHENGRTYFVVINGTLERFKWEYFTLEDGGFRAVMTRIEGGFGAFGEEEPFFYVNESRVSEAEFNDAQLNYGIIEVREIREEFRIFRGMPEYMHVPFYVDSLFQLQWLNL